MSIIRPVTKKLKNFQKQLLKNLTLHLVGFVSIFFLIDFFERIDNFFERNLSLGLAMRYFLLKVPFMIEKVLPYLRPLYDALYDESVKEKKVLASYQYRDGQIATIETTLHFYTIKEGG